MKLECCYCVHIFFVVNPQFSEADIALYTKRLENGYDLHDPHYEEWLCWKSISPDPPGMYMDYNECQCECYSKPMIYPMEYSLSHTQ